MNDFDKEHAAQTGDKEDATEPQTAKLKTVGIGSRFVHWFVDLLFMYAVFFVIGIVIRLFGLYSLGVFIQSHPIIWGMSGFFVYYVFCESTWGRTVGKLCTKSVVVDEKGGKPAFAAIMLRTLIRNVPFEPFSAFSSDAKMWHDTWAKTRVVKADTIRHEQ